MKMIVNMLLCAATLVSSLAQAVEYAKPGPYAVETVKLSGAADGQIALPVGLEGELPIIVIGHGFSSSANNHIGWAQHLASYGFVSLALTTCRGLFCAPDPQKSAGQIQAALAYLASPSAPASVKGRIDFARLALQGHSAGGQAFTVAAAQLQPETLVLLDPVAGGKDDKDISLGTAALPQICAPVMTLYAESEGRVGTCNKNGLWQTITTKAAGGSFSAIINGGTHCEGELPMRGLCGPFCSASPKKERQEIIKEYLAAWYLGQMMGDQEALNHMSETNLVGDTRIRNPVLSPGLACSRN